MRFLNVSHENPCIPQQTILITIDAYLGTAKMVLISALSVYFAAAGNIANENENL